MRSVVVALLLFLAVPADAQERIVIGGAGVPIPVMLALSEAYVARHPSERIEVVEKALGSTGGIRATAAGSVTIGLTARRLHPDEQAGLVYHAYGRTPLVVGAHPDVPVQSVTESQLCDVYAGRITSWKALGGPDQKMIVLMRNEDGTMETFRAQIPCFRDLKITADALLMTKPALMTEALSLRAWTIGLTDFAAWTEANGRFKPIALNGVMPTAEAMRAGQYRFYKEFGMVTLGEPRGLARDFVTFVLGPDGARIMSRHGLMSVR